MAINEVLLLAGRQLTVDPPCAGIETLCLALTSSIVFLVLFPIKRHWIHLFGLICCSLMIAILLNCLRVIVLSLSSKACDQHWWTLYCGFKFWHVGAGSQLFVLLAVSGVCALWWWDIERQSNRVVAHKR